MFLIIPDTRLPLVMFSIQLWQKWHFFPPSLPGQECCHRKIIPACFKLCGHQIEIMANSWAHHLEPLANLPRMWEQGCGSEGDPEGRPRKMRAETRERREGDRQRKHRSYCLWLKIALKLHINSASQLVSLFWAVLSVSQLTHFFPRTSIRLSQCLLNLGNTDYLCELL